MSVSNFRSTMALDAYLRAENVIGIAEIDTRRLTRILREKGAQSGCIMAGNVDEGAAVAAARDFSGLAGMDLAQVVSTKASYKFSETEWRLGRGFGTLAAPKFKVVAYDYGVKRNILRMLAERGCDLTVVPAKTPAAEVRAMQPDGVFLSNGPGDPEPCDYAIAAIREIIDVGIPTFGICLGHQLLGLASGAATLKMKFGHHGANHPVKDLTTGKVEIVSMNHGFTVDRDSLPDAVTETHVSLFDGTNCGIAVKDKPIFSVQHHPEASPGPADSLYLFDRFSDLMTAR
jgi:carbamoyl-phosphate synthase small subunit